MSFVSQVLIMFLTNYHGYHHLHHHLLHHHHLHLLLMDYLSHSHHCLIGNVRMHCCIPCHILCMYGTSRVYVLHASEQLHQCIWSRAFVCHNVGTTLPPTILHHSGGSLDCPTVVNPPPPIRINDC